MTHKEKLKAVIESQIRGGYTMWRLFTDPYIKECGVSLDGVWWAKTSQEPGGAQSYPDASNMGFHTLQVLLDTTGAKAAYPVWWCEDCKEGEGDNIMGPCPDDSCPFHLEGWREAQRQILWAWHSGDGNNWKAAIDTAFSLLPK